MAEHLKSCNQAQKNVKYLFTKLSNRKKNDILIKYKQ